VALIRSSGGALSLSLIGQYNLRVTPLRALELLLVMFQIRRFALRRQFENVQSFRIDTSLTNIMPVQFRAKRLDIGGFINKWVIRDHTKRKVYEEYEPERQALRYIIRNTSLPQRMRAAAQLQLAQMHCYTRSTQINNRCIGGGRARGVYRDFRLARVSRS
jgi:small subunit ribosomal protein S14